MLYNLDAVTWTILSLVPGPSQHIVALLASKKSLPQQETSHHTNPAIADVFVIRKMGVGGC